MKQVTLDKTKKAIFSAIVEASEQLDWEIKDKSMYYGTVTCQYSGGLLSYGNFIDIKIKPAHNGKYTVQATSRSAARIQLIDWGTNSNLEADIIESLKEILD